MTTINDLNRRLDALTTEIRAVRRIVTQLAAGLESDRLTRSDEGVRLLPDGTRFVPGTGLLDAAPDRPRSPEVQAAIRRDNEARQ